MSGVSQSRWFKLLLVFPFLLFTAQCGDDSEIIVQELDCMLEGFEGGNYSFTVDSVSNTCGLEQSLLDQFVRSGDQFGPVVLPGVQNLPPTIDIPFDPPIGTVTVAITVQGDRLRVSTTTPITIFINGLGNVTGTVSGNLCPLEGGEIVAGFTISITAPFPCNVPVTATGTLQGG